jgi:hypothetical protein
VQDFELWKRGGVASEVHYIAIHFLFEFKVFVSPVKPLLECLHNSRVQWAGGAWAVHGTG